MYLLMSSDNYYPRGLADIVGTYPEVRDAKAGADEIESGALTWAQWIIDGDSGTYIGREFDYDHKTHAGAWEPWDRVWSGLPMDER